MTDAASVFGLTIPDAEKGVLGVILLTGGRALDETPLSASDFSDLTLAAIFEGMQAVHRGGVAVDEITVGDRVPEHAALVWKLRDYGLHEANLPSYTSMVLNRSVRSKYLDLAKAILELPETVDADRVAEFVDTRLAAIPITTAVTVDTFADLLEDAIIQMETPDLYAPTPWAGVNDVIGGFRPGKVYVFAGRPADGKSLAALQAAIGLAEHGWVAFSSLEMSGIDLVKRAISSTLSIPVGNVNDSTMSAFEWERFAAGRSTVAELRIAVDANAGATPSSIRRHAYAVQRKGRLSAIVVDYIQLMSAPDGGENRQTIVAEFSRSLRLLAKELQVPVIVLSQLGRGSDKRPDGRPVLADLRESGAIENDADCVILLQRDKEEGTITFIIAKNRHGRTADVELAFEGAFSRISDMGRDHLDMPPNDEWRG
jgi:replicative DNA helicase